MRQRNWIILMLLFILVLQVILRLPFLHVPLERDEGAYGYMAQRILAGEVPYRDAFDHKPPLVYFTYAVLVKFFGNSIEAIRFPALFYSLVTTISLFYLGFLLWGAGAGLLAALFYAVFSGGVLIQGYTSNTETFMVLPLILALYFFVKGEEEREEGIWFLWAGLFSGAAFMFKQVAAFNFLILLLFLFRKGKWRAEFDFNNALRLILGASLIPLAFVIYFIFQGALADFIRDVFLVNIKYLRSLQVELYDRIIFGGVVTLFRAGSENAILWLFGALGILWIIFKDRSREHFLLVFWALASFVGVMASGLFFGHYYIQLIPVLCLLSAYALAEIRGGGGVFLKGLLVLASLILILKIIPYQYPFYFKYTPEEISQHQHGKRSYIIGQRLAQEFKKTLKPQETILVWPANPQLYFYLDKKAPTRYYNYLQWMEDEEVREEVVSSILDNKPDYIVWTLYAFPYPELVKLIQDEYQLYFTMESWKVFKRNK
jgi:4-amino-4-deoxy-L-arabinose transferase-like glycosyltransferase